MDRRETKCCSRYGCFTLKKGILMTKLLGPDFFNLEVRDLAVSRAFYTEVLGLSIDPRFNTADVVAFDTTTIPFALSKPKGNLDEALHPGRGVSLWIDCDDVDGLCAK